MCQSVINENYIKLNEAMKQKSYVKETKPVISMAVEEAENVYYIYVTTNEMMTKHSILLNVNMFSYLQWPMKPGSCSSYTAYYIILNDPLSAMQKMTGLLASVAYSVS
jgi:hypothetical protein